MELDGSPPATGGGPLSENARIVRVKKDEFHFMRMLDKFIPADWHLRSEFYRDLDDAMHELDKDDLEKVNKTLPLIGENITIEDMLRKDSKWLWKRVRRYIPEPTVLEARLLNFWNKWGQVSADGPNQPHRQLFGSDAQNTFKNMIKAVQADQISDPPGIDLFELERTDRYGLPIYRCKRGTNRNESFHNKLNEGAITENASIEWGDHITAVSAYEHNVDNATARKALPFFGHTELWNIDKVQALSAAVLGEPHYKDYAPINTFDLRGETTGVTKVFSHDTSQQLVPDGATPWTQYRGDKKYLSDRTGSLIPAFPVHTKEERQLFRDIKTQYAIEGNNSKIDFKAMARGWDEHVDGVNILRKAPHHLEDYGKIQARAQKRWTAIQQFVQQGHQRAAFRTVRTTPLSRDDIDSASDRSYGSVETSSTHSSSCSELMSDLSGAEDTDEDVSASSAVLQPAAAPYVPAPALGNRVTPQHTLTTLEGPETGGIVNTGKTRTRTCRVCQQVGCPGANNRKKCRENPTPAATTLTTNLAEHPQQQQAPAQQSVITQQPEQAAAPQQPQVTLASPHSWPAFPAQRLLPYWPPTAMHQPAAPGLGPSQQQVPPTHRRPDFSGLPRYRGRGGRAPR